MSILAWYEEPKNATELAPAKDHELQQAVKDYESRLTQVTQSLAEFKHRALTAEVCLTFDHPSIRGIDSFSQLKLEESSTNSTRTQELEKEVKEKNLLIGKLRHEGLSTVSACMIAVLALNRYLQR